MDAEGKKRRLEKEEEDDDDEEKMQKFFALIRSTREIRERIKGGPQRLQEEEKRKGHGVWNPSFQPEDFREGGGEHSKGLPPPPPPPPLPPPPQESLGGPSKSKDETKEEEKDAGGDRDEELDLNLSL